MSIKEPRCLSNNLNTEKIGENQETIEKEALMKDTGQIMKSNQHSSPPALIARYCRIAYLIYIVFFGFYTLIFTEDHRDL